MDRQKLDTMIEKEARKLLKESVEWSIDNVVLSCRKKGVPVEGADLARVTDLFRDAMNRAFLTRVDNFQKGVSRHLDEYISEETKVDRKKVGNATQRGESTKD